MNKKPEFRSIPTGNPLANALMLVVGALAVGAAIVLGFLAFIVLVGIVVVLAGVVGIRLWWFNRSLRKNRLRKNGMHKNSTTQNVGNQANSGDSTKVIEGEYRVVSTGKQRDSGD
ncbi:MAG: hypothetical protein WDZ50_01835 [Woeseia sp.]